MLVSLDERFDAHLAQAENLTSLFVAIYDGVSIQGLHTLTVLVGCDNQEY